MQFYTNKLSWLSQKHIFSSAKLKNVTCLSRNDNGVNSALRLSRCTSIEGTIDSYRIATLQMTHEENKDGDPEHTKIKTSWMINKEFFTYSWNSHKRSELK